LIEIEKKIKIYFFNKIEKKINFYFIFNLTKKKVKKLFKCLIGGGLSLQNLLQGETITL